jgi:hypothetical protein
MSAVLAHARANAQAMFFALSLAGNGTYQELVIVMLVRLKK